MIRFLMLFLLGLLVYANSFSNKFLVDDYAFLANPTTHSTKFLLEQFSPYQQFDEFHDPQEWRSLAYYRPLAHIVPAICYATFGNHFWQYHLFNLVLFVLAAFLIYLCIFRISKNDSLGLLVSVIYLIHPINGIVVNYITASVFAVQVICIALSILCVWESIERQENQALYYLSLLFMGLALLCHETSIMTPFYVTAVLVVTQRLETKKLIKCLIPYFLLLLIYLVFRTYFVSLNDLVLQKMSGYKMGFFEYIATLFTIIAWYISQIFFPNGIVLVWATPVVRENLFLINLSFLALICFFATSLFIFRRDKMVQIGLWWFLIGFLPMAAAPFSRPYDGVDIEPHWFVFSVIGFFILVAHSLLSVCSRLGKSKKWLGWFLMLLLGASWIGISCSYNRLWSSEERYVRYWLSQMPQLKSLHAYLGNAYRLQGNWKEARKNYLLGLTGGPGDVAMYIDLGSVEKRMGRLKEAEGYYKECLKIFPSSFENYANLGGLYLMQGNLELAQEYYVRALMINPYEIPTLEALISISIKKNDISSLRKYVDLYIEREKSPQALMLFGDAMVRNHLGDIAFKSYQKAVTRNPDDRQIQELLIKEKELVKILHANRPPL